MIGITSLLMAIFWFVVWIFIGYLVYKLLTDQKLKLKLINFHSRAYLLRKNLTYIPKNEELAE